MAEDKNYSRLASIITERPKRAPSGLGYSRFVRLMRIVLPLCVLVAFGFVLSWSQVEDKITPIATEELEMTAKDVRNELINPRFEGVDKKGNPFTVTADKAMQKDEDPDKIILEAPVADMALSSGKWLAIKSDTGSYDQIEQNVDLEGNVFVYHDSGYELTSNSLHADMNRRYLSTTDKVQGKGENMALSADGGMEVFIEENKLVLAGPVNIHLKSTGNSVLNFTD